MGDAYVLLLRIGYGTLKLLPDVVAALTPGQLTDLVLARVWVQEERERRSQPVAPMEMRERASKLDEFFARRAALGQPILGGDDGERR